MNESLLVNTLGHSAGVLIFGIFLYLLVQDRSARHLPASRKAMLAALLALIWNLASLIVLGTSPDGALSRVTAGVGFSVLSLLPALLFDLCLPDRLRVLVRLGYALSGVTIVLHVTELFRENANSHRLGLTLISAGFGALTCVAAVGMFASRERYRGAKTSRLVGTMSLFLLAMSFVHLRSAHVTQVWSRELAFHHAAIPLAMLVLLQDYRFVLVDAFLRFLANIFLAALFTTAAVAAWRSKLVPSPATPFGEALLLAGLCLLFVVFAILRSTVQRLLTRLVFRRPDLDALIEDLKMPVRDEGAYLAAAARRIGEFMGAEAVVSNDASLAELDLRRPAVVSELPPLRRHADVEAIVPIRIPASGAQHILLGRRSGGRRYLSEDLQSLARAAGHIVEQVEQYRESEMRRLVAQAELRALQSQIHPHFLFNALNTLYGIIPREAKGARETVLNLADIFRYFLETEKTFLPLEEELHIVKAYLEVERLRLGDKLRTEIVVEPQAATTPIPILSIQPLVENAVKHGIAPKPEGGLVRLVAFVDNGSLRVSVSDTGTGFRAKSKSGEGPGVGLDNVRRRLQLCYGAAARLEVQTGDRGTAVSFLVPAASAAAGRVAEVAR